MGALAYVETLDRRGELLGRHAVTRLPCRIGRGYDADVLIDDPHVDAAHLEIEDIKPEGVLVHDLGSFNGTQHLGAKASFKSGMVLPDDVLRLGQTQIRIRSCYAPVTVAQPISRNVWRERLTSRTSAAIALLVFLLVTVAAYFFETATQDALKEIFSGVVATILVLAGAVIVSAVINRIFAGVSHFATHVILVSLGYVVMRVTASIIEYIFFTLDLPGTQIAKLAVILGALAVMFYLQLGFITRAKHISRLMTVLILSGGLAGWVWVDKALDPDNYAKQNYNTIIKPGASLIVPGVKPAIFFEQAQELKSRVNGRG